MKVNPIQVAMPFRGTTKVNKPENKIAEAKLHTAPAIQAKPSLELIQVMSGVKPMSIAKPAPVAHDNTQAAQAIKDAGVMGLSKEDYKNVKKVLARGDEQTSNVMMQLQMIKSGDIEASTVSHYWATGKMNDNLANDLDMIYEARKAGKNPIDVYVPEVKSQKEGTKNAKVGDVFKVADQDKIN